MEPDRSIGMKKICSTLDAKKIPIEKLSAIDLFARKGDWQTFVYANRVNYLETWEIDPAFEQDLKHNLPKANVRITNSIAELQNGYNKKYDFIVIDNPQNTFGPNNEYCEHFDVMPHLVQLIDKKAIIIFNINKNPFNLEKYPEWQKRRAQFYKSENTTNLEINKLEQFYIQYFGQFLLKTNFNFSVFREECKPLDYLYYFVFELQKKNNHDKLESNY